MIIFAIVIVLVGFGLSQWAAGRFATMVQEASKRKAPAANTAAEMARLFLAFEGNQDVEIIEHDGTVTNYYDPRRRKLFLSARVANGSSMADWAIALHEAAHAGEEGASAGEFVWRQTVIKLCRYGPVFAGVAAFGAMFFLKVPPRLAVSLLLFVCMILLLLNFGTLSTEFKANTRLQKFLEKHLGKWPGAHDDLNRCLQAVAIREAGDIWSSPRYFFFSALPGSGSSRPKKRKKE